MRDDLKQEALIVSSSNTPIIRAEFSNFILFLLFIGLIFINKVLIDFGFNFYLKFLILLGVCLIAFSIYNQSISRLHIKDEEELIITGPLFKSIFKLSEIEKVEVYGIPSSMTIFVTIKKKNSLIPKFYYFIAISTNYGAYADTKDKLISLFEKYKIGPAL